MTSPHIVDADNNPQKGAASFSLKHRLIRMIWGIAWLFLASWTPPQLHRWRVFLLNIFGANVHPTAHVYSSVKIWYPSNLTMAEFSCLAPRVNCYNMSTISIGKGAIVSQDTVLCGGTHDINNPLFQLITKPIYIGEGAWIAANCFVGPGVKIADKSVLGACAVTFKDTIKSGVYIGNPAKLLKMRNSNNE